MILIIIIYQVICIDLTTLQLDQSYAFNHSIQFKTQLQMDYQIKPTINPMPQNLFSDEARMNQIIYEQEERVVPRDIVIKDEPAPSPYKTKYEEIPEDEKPQTKAKLPRKKLQEETLEGEPIIDFVKLTPLAQRHKIALLIFFIFILCVFILMREMYFKSLHKIFRQYLWKITVETMYCIFILIIMITLYYNNYFDFWLLNSQYQQELGKEDIQLIEIHDYDENYKFNIYAYILISGLIVLILYLLQFMQIFIFDKQMEYWQLQENKWNNKYQLVQLYKKQQDELTQKKNLLQQFFTDELQKEINQIEETLNRTEKCMDYLLLKLQFLNTMAPYIGPTKLNDSFNLYQYLGYLSANAIYQLNIWDMQQCLNIIFCLFILVCLLYFINIIIVSILVCIILFVKIINLNYSIIVIKDKCLIKREFDNLQEEEMQFVPPFMEPIFDNILPKRPVDIQSDLFPFGNKQYYITTLSTLYKISTSMIFITNVYFFNWQHYSIYIVIICNIICMSTWISIFYISNNIIEQFVIITSLFIRNYDFINNVCRNQKIQLIEACNQFFELMRFIKKQSFQQPLQKENLLLLRPCIVDIIEICKFYQQKGVQQVQFDPREIELVDMGIESMDLIPKKYLREIVETLTDQFSEQDLVYIDSFCSDSNPDYFSPIKLNLYLHLRQQEILQNSRHLISEVLEKVIPMTFDIPQQIEGDMPNDYVQQGLKGYIDINILDNFLQESVKSNYFKEDHRKILIQELKRLKSKKVESISDFICDQISQLPI